MAWHDTALDLTLMTASHMKYSFAEGGILKTYHTYPYLDKI